MVKYHELEQRAKNKAKLAWQTGETDIGWWDSVYEDAIEAGGRLGIQIGSTSNRTARGTYDSPDITFSGFWYQGDGCSFGGRLLMAGLAGAVERIKEYAPKDEELLALAVRAETLHSEAAAVVVADRLADQGEKQFPEFSLTSVFMVKGTDHRGFRTRLDEDEALPEDWEKDVDSFLEDFASWIYDQLEATHEHLTSEESFAHWVESNEPDFDEEGNLE